MQRLSIALVMLVSGVAHAQSQPLPPTLVEFVSGDTMHFSWENATQMTDGSPISGVPYTALAWATVANGRCEQWIGELQVEWPGTEVDVEADEIGLGSWCFFAYHGPPLDGAGSDWSEGVVTLITEDGGEPNEPAPAPYGKLVAPGLVFGADRRNDGYQLFPVGTAEVGVECLMSSVNGLHVVPRAAVIEWIEDVRPNTVIGDCR